MNPHKQDFLHWLGMAVVTLALIFVAVAWQPAEDRQERIDSLLLGPWVVEASANSVPVYVALEDHSTGLLVDLNWTWTRELDEAWRYTDKASADADVLKFPGSRAKSIRMILAEVSQ